MQALRYPAQFETVAATVRSPKLPRPHRSSMQLSALDLRKGYLIVYEGRMCNVIYWNILRNDRRQFVQMKVKDLLTGRVQEMKEHGETKYEVVNHGRQYL